MNIDWIEWSAIAQIIGTVAILITLIYLAVQTRQNTAAILSNTRDTIINSDLHLVELLMEHPLYQYMHNLDEATIDNKQNLQNWLIALARSREHQFFQYKDGLLDKKTWEAYITGITINLSYPVTRAWWDYVSSDFFDKDFVNELNKYLKNIPIDRNNTHYLDRIKPL